MGFWATFYALATLGALLMTYLSQSSQHQRVGLALFVSWILSNWVYNTLHPVEVKVALYALIDLAVGAYVALLSSRHCRLVFLSISSIFVLMVAGHVATLLSAQPDLAFPRLSVYLNVLYLTQLVILGVGSLHQWAVDNEHIDVGAGYLSSCSRRSDRAEHEGG